MLQHWDIAHVEMAIHICYKSLFKMFICFISMLQVFYLYIAKVDLDVAYTCILQEYVLSILDISYVCCKCFI